MPVRRLAAALFVTTLGLVPPLVAQRRAVPRGLEIVQESPRRSGFWGSLGIGVGTETYTPAAVDPGWLARPTFNLRVGGTPSRDLRLGADLISWVNDAGGSTQSLGGLAAAAQLYPSPFTGFFLKAGGGLAWNRFSDPSYYGFGRTITTDTGYLWTVGAGWEIPVSSKLNLMPTVDYYRFEFGGPSYPDYSEKLWNFGISVEIP